MAGPQQKPSAFTPYSPISEHQNEGFIDYEEPAGGGCLGRFCFWWSWNHDDGSSSHNHLLQRGAAHKDSWLVAKFKKVREHSELVAGPKWKNFIRKIGKLCNSNRQAGPAPVQFQYSPESYALNFAGDGDVEEDGTLLHSFSSRYAPRALLSDNPRRAAGS